MLDNMFTSNCTQTEPVEINMNTIREAILHLQEIENRKQEYWTPAKFAYLNSMYGVKLDNVKFISTNLSA